MTSSPEQAAVEIAHLPDECIARALVFLEDFCDVLSFGATCKRFKALEKDPQIWRKRLSKDFHLDVQAANLDLLPELYKRAVIQPTVFIRFRGVFTDGGVDGDLPRLWVDNLFRACSWNHTCTALGKNVNCIGLLTEDAKHPHEPSEELELREYLVERVLLCHFIMGGPADPGEFTADAREEVRADLTEWTTEDLESLLTDLLWEHTQGTNLGAFLFHRVPASRLPAELARARSVRTRRLREQNKGLRDLGVVSGRENRNVLMDKGALEALLGPRSGQESLAGVVEGVRINRQGHYSCPVASGVIFGATMQSGATLDPSVPVAESAAMEFAGMLTSEGCSRFSDMAAVMHLVNCHKEGTMPGIVACGSTAAGQWCEFHPDWRCPSTSTVRPIAWFRFWTRPQAVGYQKLLGIQWQDAPGTRSAWPRVGGPVAVRAWRQRPKATCPRLQGLVDTCFAAGQLQESDGAEMAAPTHPARNFVLDRLPRDLPDNEDNLLNINKLDFDLACRRTCDALVVKLIEAEDRMELWHDHHPEPNLDVTYVALRGRTIRMPVGVQLCR